MDSKFCLKGALALGVAVLIAGCAHLTAWNDRVGHYTFEQAVNDYGQPSDQETAADGTLSAVWITRFPHAGTELTGAGAYRLPDNSGVVPAGPTYDESRMHLMFNTNHVLTGWSRN